MKTTFEDYDQLTVMKLHGDLTADDVEAFRKAAKQRLDQQVRDFVIDVHEVEFIDSQGLEAVLWLQEATAEQLGQVRMVQVSPNVKTILEITRLASRFECHEDIDNAIRSLR